MSDFSLEDVCVVACAEAFRGDGEIMASPMAPIPKLGALLAAATFEPDLVLTDGVASIIRPGPDGPVTEGWMPYRSVFDVVWSGKRHVMMGATQIDRHGNQNISCIGPWSRPKVQLLGVRGAPGNTINHVTSYWVPKHNKRVFVPAVDVVAGVGYDRAAELGEVAARFHEIRRVITNLGVFDFESAERTMRLRSIHPGVDVQEIVDNTGFEIVVPDDVPITREPSAEESEILGQLRGDS